MRHRDEGIGRRLAQARKEAGLTQEQLAEQVGVTPRSIQGYEAGKVVPYRHLKRLEEITGKPPSWLLRNETEPTPFSAEVAERLVSLVERVAAEAERLADAAARIEGLLDVQQRPRAFDERS
jgi:transcriptional regulator with XRE-family HTH domain